ncbi:uncharacterized protein EMH_0001140 [Eimeria mitis]|uniref:Uncharacterized protein n=1 Tax=Eimeria mitis TaxID=44415 RepID=U6KDV1_9EIME|nr:uncharacterized protein EMH_0001140 [Eimeria mitis]CDJ34397.1 hypothetical protein EMH_0001140 [Eimeria mitis]
MSEMSPTSNQESVGGRRGTKRQRRRSDGLSPREVMPLTQQQAPDLQTAPPALLPGVRTRRLATTGQDHPQRRGQNDQLRRYEQRTSTQRRSVRRHLQLRQRHSPDTASGACETASNPVPSEPNTQEGLTEDVQSRQVASTNLCHEGQTARASTRQRRRAAGSRGPCGCTRSSSSPREPIDPEGSTCALRTNSGLSQSPSSWMLGGSTMPALERIWIDEEEEGKELLNLLSKARSALLEPLFEVSAGPQLDWTPSSNTRPTGILGFSDASEEPSVWLSDANGSISSLRVFSGAAYLSQKQIATLSQAASGVSPLIAPNGSIVQSAKR